MIGRSPQGMRSINKILLLFLLFFGTFEIIELFNVLKSRSKERMSSQMTQDALKMIVFSPKEAPFEATDAVIHSNGRQSSQAGC